ncbi:unnamed protein product, partial [Meganyctiphanes norvegica]
SDSPKDEYLSIFTSHMASIIQKLAKKNTDIYVVTETHNKSIVHKVFQWWQPKHNVLFVDKIPGDKTILQRIKSSKGLYSSVESGLWIIIPSIYSIAEATPKKSVSYTPIPTMSNFTFVYESKINHLVSLGEDMHRALSQTLGKNHTVVLLPPIPAAVCGLFTEHTSLYLLESFEKFSLNWTKMAHKIFLNNAFMHDPILDYQKHLLTKKDFVKNIENPSDKSLNDYYNSWLEMFKKTLSCSQVSLYDLPIFQFTHAVVVGNQMATKKLQMQLNPELEVYNTHLNFYDQDMAVKSMRALPLAKPNRLWIIPTDASNWLPGQDMKSTYTNERVAPDHKKAVGFVDELLGHLGEGSAILLTPMVPQTLLYVPQVGGKSVPYSSKLMIMKGAHTLFEMVQQAQKLWLNSETSPMWYAICK